MRIVVDPGHLRSIDGVYLIPGKRSPEVPPGIYEGDFNWVVAGHLAQMLRERGHEVTMTYDATARKNIKLQHRVNVSRGADLFVSIHANAAGKGGWTESARGSVVFTNDAGFNIGQRIHEALGSVKAIPQRFHRARRHSGLYVLRRNTAPAVLVECGFMTSHADVEFLSSMHGQGVIARAICEGIV